jgi:hypothetical protein
MKWKIISLTIMIILLTASCSLPPGVEESDDIDRKSISPTESKPLDEKTLTPAVSSENDWWQPAVDTSWQWQLEGEIDTSFDVDLYDLDLFETSPALVQELKDDGRYPVCYISVGSWEDWRPDAGGFPPEVLGNNYPGWPGEKWLDIRQIDTLAPILRARLDLCAAKGFDGVEPDNIDGYTNNTGFNLTYGDQLTFNIWLANEAHARGLSIGLKNDSEQVLDLLPYFDWALTEDCFEGDWCEEMLPFIESGKPVLAAEYTDTGITLEDFCIKAREMGLSAILKNRDLDAFREDCRSD